MIAELRWWHLLVGCALMGFTGSIAFMWFDTTPPYEFDASQSKIIPSEAEAGMQIRVDWKVKVNRVCGGMNTRELFDPVTKVRIAIYDPIATASIEELEKGEQHLIRTFLLPRRMSKGPVGYRAHLQYKCNWLQNFFPIEVTTPDLFFELVDHLDN